MILVAELAATMATDKGFDPADRLIEAEITLFDAGNLAPGDGDFIREVVLLGKVALDTY